jgi:formate dehydrogenase subunit delta
MDSDKLIHMANRIGDFFAAYSDQNEAKAGIANHIQKFWEPRMRSEILQLLEQAEGDQLSSLVRAALRDKADALRPKRP